MLEPIRRLLNEASTSTGTKAFWQAAARILSEWAGGALVQLDYRGLNESGAATAGTTASGSPVAVDWQDTDGRHVHGEFAAIPPGAGTADVRATIEVATHLAVMVGRRASLERERRLGTFLVELSRWLLAAPERELLLRYTLESLLSLVDAQGAYVALRGGEGGMLRVAATVGHCVEFDGFEIGLTTSTTGRVVRTGDALLTQNILAEPDCSPALSPSGTARGALIAPLRTAGGVQGAQASGDRRVCDCTITGLSGIDSKNLLVALYDRTDELRAERELVAREKLATVGEIASGVAHEVNNPLAAIRMEAELLARASRDPDVTAAAATMTREVDRAARIVRSLLRLARRADMTPTRVQMNELV